ncbi:hypothetical protein HZS61_007946 [Fusarium oxysporum f. sp. conglutinans]|uniref:Peptidase S9 prolyl oligopeptidase catalytic domain-containing protein n=1 Tax=Fusarium oxysporum f. sp. conglutinans TaxID=100902 RepID=A0A8H6LPG7_FUSOX|nr:hypothetical protein HZS61_007946 [Fusarium oxysporum f. sp. conglutinans]
MTAPGGKYYIHDQLDAKQPHHESFAHLWETRWEPLRDFKEIAEEMIRRDFREPYEWKYFASMFDPHASSLYEMAEAAEVAGELEKASEYYLRAANVWFICRYPAILNDIQRNAWERSRASVLKGLRLRGINMQEVLAPYKHGLEREGSHIPIWICGLDSWRPEMSCFAGVFQACGLGMIIAEVPGTGDSPALADDPTSPDRQWSSVLDWIDQNEAIDSNKVVGWGISTGGYYATRAAYTHNDRFLGLISHGGAAHHAFDPKWLENIDYREFAHRQVP